MKKNVVLFEAKPIDPASLTGSVWRVKVIEGDRQGSSAFYPKEVVEAGAPLFKKGTRVYRNHPTADEKWSRPERSIDDLIGVFEADSDFEGTDLYAPVRFFSEHQQFIKERAEAGVIGMSIRANGDVEETADGPVLKAFTSVSSVDVVTTAGAGGGFESLLESAREEISASESVVDSPEKKKELVMDEAMKTALDELVESNKQTAAGLKVLTDRAAAEDAAKAAELAEASKPKAISFAEIDAKLTESKLLPASRAIVLKAVEGGADLDESIADQKKLAETLLTESGAEFRGNEQGTGHKETSLEEATDSARGSIYS